MCRMGSGWGGAILKGLRAVSEGLALSDYPGNAMKQIPPTPKVVAAAGDDRAP